MGAFTLIFMSNNGGASKGNSRGHFTRIRDGASAPAKTHGEQPGKAEPQQVVRELVYARRSFVGRAAAGVFLLVGALCAGWISWSFLGDAIQDLIPMILLGMTVLVFVGAHGFTTWWSLTSRPHWTQWVILHAPYPPLYLMTYLWFFGKWDRNTGGPPSTWYLYWAAAASVGLSWLIVWWLRGERRNPRRAVAFFAGLALIVLANGAGIAVDRFTSTDGFGLRGQATPAQAWQAFTAASCLFKYPFYLKGGKDLPAPCPQGKEAASADLASLISNDQPREVLNRWYAYHQQFQYLPGLTDENAVINQSGDTATLTVAVVLESGDEGQDLSLVPRSELWCVSGGRTEQWTVQLETAPLGGWKVSGIDVADRVYLSPYVGSTCDAASGS
jgi:hypothetical protein